MPNPLVAGRVMIALGVVGIVVAVVATVSARQLVVGLDEGVARSLVLSAEVLETLDDSFVLAQETMRLVEDGIAEAERATRGLEGSLEEGRSALDTASEVTGGELAGSLEAVESTLPDLEQAAGAMDQSLRALAALPLGVAYDPERPLDESISSLRTEFEGLPDELRELGDDTGAAAAELGAAQEGTEGVADALSELTAGMEDATALVDQYAVSVAEVRALVDEQQAALDAQVRRASVAVILVGAVFAAGQFVPIYLGVALVRGLVAREPDGPPGP